MASIYSKNIDFLLSGDSFSDFGRYVELLFMSQSKPIVKTFFKHELSAILISDCADGKAPQPFIRSQLLKRRKLRHSERSSVCANKTIKSNLLINLKEEIRYNCNQRKKELVFGEDCFTSFLRIEEFNILLRNFTENESKISQKTEPLDDSEFCDLQSLESGIRVVEKPILVADNCSQNGMFRSLKKTKNMLRLNVEPSTPKTLALAEKHKECFGGFKPLVVRPVADQSRSNSRGSYVSLDSPNSPVKRSVEVMFPVRSPPNHKRSANSPLPMTKENDKFQETCFNNAATNLKSSQKELRPAVEQQTVFSSFQQSQTCAKTLKKVTSEISINDC